MAARRMSESQVWMFRWLSIFVLAICGFAVLVAVMAGAWPAVAVILLIMAIAGFRLWRLRSYEAQPDRWIWKRYPDDEPGEPSRRSRLVGLGFAIAFLAAIITARRLDLASNSNVVLGAAIIVGGGLLVSLGLDWTERRRSQHER